MRRIFSKRLAIALAVAALVAGGVQVVVAMASGGSDLAAARRATANYHRLSVAEDAGYAEFRDANGIACIDNLPDGAMGVHYVNGSYVGDTTLDPTTPEAVVYEPMPNGRPRLVALEYIVFQAAWDAEHSSPPELFGHEFMLVPAGNRFGIPAFYALHAWIWKDNPSGMFAIWNPRVHC
jgi:streptogramin lyase